MPLGRDVRKVTTMTEGQISDSGNKSLYKFAGIAALLAVSATLLDIILGYGETDIVVNGTKSALDWFLLFQADWFRGLYALGILNIVYMVCMLPIYFAILTAHRRNYFIVSAMATVLFLLAVAIYVSNSAAIPMLVLSGKYAVATTDAQRALFVAAGEAVLVRGEDFTPGSFPGLILNSLAALTLSYAMLRGGIFGRANGWIGIVGFTFLSLFTISATFISALYFFAFYVFGMIGGLLALTWYVLVALTLFKLGQH